MDWRQFDQGLRDSIRACTALGARDTGLTIEEPAALDDVERVEGQLGHPLPASFRQVLVEFSRRVNMYWFLAREAQPPIKGIFSGDCQWSLDDLVKLERGRQEWVRTCFPDESQPYDRVWHHKLAFANVGNGDVLALDPTVTPAPVVYLSHDDSRIHGWRLADDFQDFLRRSSRLGFVGPEDWQLEPFLGDPLSGLIVDSPNATRWRSWFGIE